jgi:hypothetical protein
VDLIANVVPRQYMVALFRQCISVLDSRQLGPLCYERFRVSLVVERHLHCRGCHVSCNVYPLGENPGRLGSSRRLPYHDSLRYFGLGSYGCVRQPSHLLRCIRKTAVLY